MMTGVHRTAPGINSLNPVTYMIGGRDTPDLMKGKSMMRKLIGVSFGQNPFQNPNNGLGLPGKRNRKGGFQRIFAFGASGNHLVR